jgi:hypothetical protein
MSYVMRMVMVMVKGFSQVGGGAAQAMALKRWWPMVLT